MLLEWKNGFEMISARILFIFRFICSAEIVIPGTGSATAPVCVVSTLNIMVGKHSDMFASSGSGWIDVQNTTAEEPQFQQPFQLFRDGGRTLLQVKLYDIRKSSVFKIKL